MKEETKKVADQSETYKGLLESAIAAASGTLSLHVTMRGVKQANEYVDIKLGDKVEVKVNSQNFDITLMFRGVCYVPTDRGMTVRMHTMAATGSIDLEGITFRRSECASVPLLQAANVTDVSPPLLKAA